jgi:hypothetical protein
MRGSGSIAALLIACMSYSYFDRLYFEKVDRLVATDYGRGGGVAVDKMFVDGEKKSRERARNVCFFALLVFENSSLRSGYKSTNGLFGLQHFISQHLYC